MDRKEIGLRVKEERDKLNWSQETLAAEGNLSLRTIQRIEKGEESINKDTLLQILNLLSIEYCDEGYISIPELTSIGMLIENLFKYKVDLKRGDFDIEELKLLLKLADFLEEFKIYWQSYQEISFKDSINKEIILREILKELEEIGIKIFWRLKYDSEVREDIGEAYGIYKSDYIENQIYVYKKNDKNILRKKNNSVYINVENTDYSNLKADRIKYGIKDSDIFQFLDLFTQEEYTNCLSSLSPDERECINECLF